MDVVLQQLKRRPWQLTISGRQSPTARHRCAGGISLWVVERRTAAGLSVASQWRRDRAVPRAYTVVGAEYFHNAPLIRDLHFCKQTSSFGSQRSKYLHIQTLIWITVNNCDPNIFT